MKGARPALLLAVATGLAAAYGCRVERRVSAGATFHPAGFAKPASADFHGGYLASHGFPLQDCRVCHGEDYAGGKVGVSCVSAGCHTKGVESCSTCHGDPPATGAHVGHALPCTECHPSRTNARSPDHVDGPLLVQFGGLASTSGYAPKFDAATGTCSGVYCHQGKTIAWKAGIALGCGGCHGDPPANHVAFAAAGTNCSTCHAGAGHVDGKVEVKQLACDGCHGKGPLGAPPPGFGPADTSPAIGAHVRHLDPSLPDRIGRVALCEDCHDVPTSTTAPGHLTDGGRATVTLRSDESYDPATRTCVVGCHWNRSPGPAWDDASGAARECDACHAFPPVKTRTGETHPPAAPSLAVCLTCHTFDPATHVDGQVTFQ